MQADIDAGGVINNEAHASGNVGEVISQDATAIVTVNQSSALALDKSALPTSVTTEGENIAYSFEVANTGNTTLTNLTINEDSFSGSNGSPAITCPVTTLAPAASTTCTAAYNTTQVDIDSGLITNTATASGTTPSSSVVTSAPSSANVTVYTEGGSVSILKSSNVPSFSFPGTAITFTYLITNTGQTILNNVTVTDSKTSTISCPATSLLPGANMSCTGNYVTTIQDAQQGSVTSIGTVTAFYTDGSSITAQSSLTVAFDPEMIRNKTLSAIRNFLNARSQLILTAAPDRYRIIRKLSQQKKPCTDAASFGSVRPTPNGATLNGSISTSQFTAEPNNLDIWAEAHAAYYNQNNSAYSRHGNFSVLYVGLDYLFTPAIVGGLLAESDIINQSASTSVNNAHGSGWLFGPYISTRLNPNLYLHTRAGWGGSNNKINPLGYYDDSFTTTRSLYNAELVGDFELKKLLIMPTVGMTYYSEKQHDFMNTLNIFIPEQTVSLGQLNFGPEFAYQFNTLHCREIGLRFTIQGLYNFIQNNSPFLEDEFLIPVARLTARTKLALDFIFPSGFSVTPMVSYDGIGTNSFNAVQAQIQISTPIG